MWTRLSAARSPLQSPAWYDAAGWGGRVRLLTGPAGRAAVPAWTVERADRPHYFHDPIEILSGERERTFTADVPELTEGVRRATGRASVLVTVSPYGYRGGAFTGDPSSAAGADAGEMAGLVGRLLEHAAGTGASMLFAHYLFDEDDAAFIRALTDAGGIRLLAGADAVLDVEWDDMDGYHRALGSSRRSLRQGRNIPDLRNLHWAEREDKGLTAEHRDVVPLLHATSAGFDPRAPVPEDMVRAIAEGALPRTLLTVAQPGRPARSAALVLRRADTLYAKFFGSAAPREDYFPLAYARLIRYAIEHGYRRIEYGGGSHQAKLLRGARLRPAWGVLFVLDPALRGRVESFARTISARKRAHFAGLARQWQVDSLPVHPAFSDQPALSPPRMGGPE